VVFVWDWFICLPREWKYVYTHEWGIANVLYIFCRITPLISLPMGIFLIVGNHDEQECLNFYKIPTVLTVLNQLASELMLVWRTYAVCGRSTPLLIGLLITLSGAGAFELWVADNTGLAPVFPNLKQGCIPTDPPRVHLIAAYFLTAFSYDCIVTLLFGLSILRMQKWYRNGLLITMITEGLGYFVLISALNLTNILIYFLVNSEVAAAMVPFTLTLPNLLMCRLTLNLRSFRDQNRLTTIDTSLPMLPLSPGRSDITTLQNPEKV